MKELLVSFLLALFISSIVNGCSQIDNLIAPGSNSPTPQDDVSDNQGESTSDPSILTVTDASFNDDVIKSKVPVLVEFGAKWCNPCKMMSPILSDIAKEYTDKLKVAKVDVDQNKQLSDEYAQNGLPTLLIFQNGKQVELFVGYTPKEQLNAAIKHHLS